jgi:hypothetical protein
MTGDFVPAREAANVSIEFLLTAQAGSLPAHSSLSAIRSAAGVLVACTKDWFR